MCKHKVLIVEDSEAIQKEYAEGLDGKFEILVATTRAQARQLFAENPEVALIVMDGCVDDPDSFDTGGLVREIRQKFGGIMIAASSDAFYREKLIEAGCDYGCAKYEAHRKIMEILSPAL